MIKHFLPDNNRPMPASVTDRQISGLHLALDSKYPQLSSIFLQNRRVWGEECAECVRVCKICKQIVSKWAKRLVLEFITLQWSIVMRAELEREHWLRVGWCLGGRNGRKHLLQFCQCLQLYTCLKYYERKYFRSCHEEPTENCETVKGSRPGTS